jgi:hypothetical protein
MIRDLAQRVAVALVCLFVLLTLMAEADSRDDSQYTTLEQP